MNFQEFAVDAGGDVWFSSDPGVTGADLYRFHSGTLALAFDHSILLAQLNLRTSAGMLGTRADGAIIMSGFDDNVGDDVLVAVLDANGDQTITIDEVSIIWNSTNGDFPCSFDSLQVLEDGSILGARQGGTVLRMTDANANGIYMDVGETYVAYDPICLR